MPEFSLKLESFHLLFFKVTVLAYLFFDDRKKLYLHQTTKTPTKNNLNIVN